MPERFNKDLKETGGKDPVSPTLRETVLRNGRSTMHQPERKRMRFGDASQGMEET